MNSHRQNGMAVNKLLKPIPSITSSTISLSKLHSHSPFILSQCFKDIPAVQRWRDLSYFRSFASHPIEIEVSSHESSGYGGRNETTLGEYLNVLPHKLPYRIYMAQFPLFERIPQLKDDVDSPVVKSILEQGEVYSTSTWIGRQSLTPLHHDPKSLTNLFVQVVGRKEIRMFPPEIARDTLRLGHGTLQNTSTVDVWKESIGEGFEGVISAGDGLIIPKGWWHSVRSEDEICMSVNWWFKLKNLRIDEI